MVALSEIMTREVATVEPEMTLREALDVLRGESVSGAPVVRHDGVIGVLSATDILEFEATSSGVPTERTQQLEWGEFPEPEVWEEGAEAPAAYFVDFWSDAGAEVTERFEASDSPEWDQLDEHSVSEVMSRKVVALPPEADLREAARLMIEADIHRILVIDEDGGLQGIVSTTDVVRAVAEDLV